MLQHILVQMKKRRRMKMKVMMPQKIQHQTAQLLLLNIRYCQLATENPVLDSLDAAIKYQVLSVSHRKSSIRQLSCCLISNIRYCQLATENPALDSLAAAIKYLVLTWIPYRKVACFSTTIHVHCFRILELSNMYTMVF